MIILFFLYANVLIIMKLFRTSDADTVKACQLQFTFDLPSVVIEKRAKNLKIVLLKSTTCILTTLEVSRVAGIALRTLLFKLPLWFRSYQLYTSLFCCVNM